MRRRRAAALLLLGVLCGSACKREQPLSTCDANLQGVWRTPQNARWMLLDNRQTLEAYPLFDDSVPSGAPSVIDLSRDLTRPDGRLAGEVKRRFMVRADTCEGRAPFHVTSCSAATLQVVRGDISPPLTYAPCSWPQTLPTRVETWTRE